VVLKQNVYLGLTAFLDGGMTVQDHKIYKNTIPDDQQAFYFNKTKDALHLGTGLGLRVAINENFIVTVDYGMSLNRQDGTSGLYVGIGNIF
jgi:hypothetical protein